MSLSACPADLLSYAGLVLCIVLTPASLSKNTPDCCFNWKFVFNSFAAYTVCMNFLTLPSHNNGTKIEMDNDQSCAPQLPVSKAFLAVVWLSYLQTRPAHQHHHHPPFFRVHKEDEDEDKDEDKDTDKDEDKDRDKDRNTDKDLTRNVWMRKKPSHSAEKATHDSRVFV